MNNCNPKTRITASVFGTLLAMSGFLNHGLFEVLQGNTPTKGCFIEAIGEAHRYWIHGNEAAFTVIPNFLMTGICVMGVSLAVIIWSIKYIQVKHGATIFLLLLILLTLVGGGIGYLILVLPTWAYATRINKPLDGWEKRLPERFRKTLSGLWIYSLVATSVAWLMVMQMGIFGYFPGQRDPDAVLNIVFAFLLTAAVLVNVTFICGFARDIEEQNLNK